MQQRDWHGLRAGPDDFTHVCARFHRSVSGSTLLCVSDVTARAAIQYNDIMRTVQIDRPQSALRAKRLAYILV